MNNKQIQDWEDNLSDSLGTLEQIKIPGYTNMDANITSKCNYEVIPLPVITCYLFKRG